MRKVLTIILLSICVCAKAQTVLSLEDCRNMAIENSYTAKEARLNLLSSKYQLREARTEYFPQISFLSAAYYSYKPLLELKLSDYLEGESLDAAYVWTFENGLGNSIKLPHYGYSNSLLFMQPVFAGLRIVNGNKLATLGVKAAELNLNVQQRKTIEELDDHYWQTVSLEDKLETLGSFQSLLDNLYKDATEALSAGLITEEEYLEVKLKRNELKTSEIKLKNGIKLSKINLLNYIEYEYEFLKLDSIQVSGDNEEVVNPIIYYVDETEIASKLEEMALLDMNIEAKKLQKEMELGQTLPQVLLGASLQQMALGDKRRDNRANAIVFATVSVPISDWWKTSLKQHRLQTEVDKAIEQKEYLENQLILLVRKTWVELCSAWDEYQIALDSQLAAKQSYERMQTQYSSGLVTMSELLQSQASLQQTSSSICDAKITYKKSLRRWLDYTKLKY